MSEPLGKVFLLTSAMIAGGGPLFITLYKVSAMPRVGPSPSLHSAPPAKGTLELLPADWRSRRGCFRSPSTIPLAITSSFILKSWVFQEAQGAFIRLEGLQSKMGFYASAHTGNPPGFWNLLKERREGATRWFAGEGNCVSSVLSARLSCLSLLSVHWRRGP